MIAIRKNEPVGFDDAVLSGGDGHDHRGAMVVPATEGLKR
jgi:hypothetical protein